MPKDKHVDPRHEELVRVLHQHRASMLKELEEKSRPGREIVIDLADTERLLRRHDPNFEQPLRRLSFMQPIDAAIMLLMEAGNVPMREGVLIDLMLAHGVCLASPNPRSYIKRAFSRESVRKKLHFDEATGSADNPCVTISRGYFDLVSRKSEGRESGDATDFEKS